MSGPQQDTAARTGDRTGDRAGPAVTAGAAARDRRGCGSIRIVS